MSKKTTAVVIVALASYACLATLWAGVRSLERRSQEELLRKLAMARPGVRLSEVRDRLGSPYGEYSSPDDVLAWGRIKERAFCKDKKLFHFHASTPPCRTVDVYTDANDIIVHATWTGL